jgi:hypothetical protein
MCQGTRLNCLSTELDHLTFHIILPKAVPVKGGSLQSLRRCMHTEGVCTPSDPDGELSEIPLCQCLQFQSVGVATHEPLVAKAGDHRRVVGT